MPTLIISDACAAELRLALGAAPTPVTPPPATQPDLPPGVVVVDVPWAVRTGSFTARINPGQTVAFAFTPQDTHFAAASFVVSPTDGDSYFTREVCLSESPGAFEGLITGDRRVYFTAGASFPMDKYGRLDTRYPCLDPGKRYFVNVRQKDRSLTCRVNYALTPA